MKKCNLVIACLSVGLSACDRLPDYRPVDEVYWPKQNWTEDQRQRYYHTAQGTQLMPYRWFMALEQPRISLFGAPLFREDDYIARFGFLPDPDRKHNPDQLPVGFAVDPDFVDPNTGRGSPVVGITCAGCHTGQVEVEKDGTRYGIRIEGGPANADLDKFSRTLGFAVGMTYYDPLRFRRFARAVLGENYSSEAKAALNEEMKSFMFTPGSLAAAGLLTDYDDPNTSAGFGRLSALERIGNVVFVNLGKKNLAVANAPANFPFLWDVSWFDWIQYNGSINQPMARNVGEALGVYSPVNLTDATPPKVLFQSTVKIDNLYELEQLLGGPNSFEDPNVPYQGLTSPPWPEQLLGKIDPQKAAKGSELYHAFCESCHLPPRSSADIHAPQYWSQPNSYGKRFLKVTLVNVQDIGTDPTEAINFAQRIVTKNKTANLGAAYSKDGKGVVMAGRALEVLIENITELWYEQHNVSKTDRDRMNGFRNSSVRAPLAYKARPLNGIWATAPFLHNGSVPNLYQLLAPIEQRDRTFYTGNKSFDPVHVGFQTDSFPGGFEFRTDKTGNSNKGHEFTDQKRTGVIGPLLSEEQRWQLIEYLKTL